MAFTVIQDPLNPNAAYTRLLTVVSGSIYDNEPQFQYVCDVYQGSNLLKRMTQPVNPAGTATFDVARIVQGELSVDYNWKINSVTPFNSSSKEFTIKMGEQFGTSISSSVTVYPDQDIQNLIVFQGVVEPNAGAYSFSLVVDSQILSNMPSTMSMQSDDFGTISVYNDQGTYISQSFYSASSITNSYELVDSQNYTTTGTYFNAVPISSSKYWDYVDVSISSSFGTEAYRYESETNPDREKVRFAFINKLGAWDYFNNYNPVRQAIKVEREQYTAPRVDFSSRTSPYNIEKRGLSDYHNNTDDVFTVDTDFLDQNESSWLEELIESPEVYIQKKGEFIPVLITDSSYIANTNQARQKLFKYTINFKPSNQPYGKWESEFVNCPDVVVPIKFIVDTVSATDVTYQSMTLNGGLRNQDRFDGISEVGFVYSTSSTTPIIPTSYYEASPGFTTPITASSFSLQTGNKFTELSTVYYRAYASSSNGIGYGDIQFQQTVAFVSMSVVTNDAFGSDCDGFSGSIFVTTGDDTATGQGFVYSDTVTNPTIGTGTQVSIPLPADTTATKGVGGLDSNTTYYVRGYGIGAASGTVYGDVKTIVTDIATPSISSIAPAFGISNNSFSLSGSATATEKPIVEKGFVYSTSNTNPTIADTKVAVGSGDGVYTTAIAGASDETTYYARAYASSSCDLAYSTAISLETLPILYPMQINATATNGFSTDLAMCDVTTTNIAYSRVEFPRTVGIPTGTSEVYEDISGSTVFNGDGLLYGINNSGTLTTAGRRLTIDSSGFVTSQLADPCPSSKHYYTLEECSTGTQYYSNFNAPFDDNSGYPVNTILQDQDNAYLQFKVTGRVYDTGSLPQRTGSLPNDLGTGSCPSFTFYEYRVNADTYPSGSPTGSGGTNACNPDLSFPIYSTQSTLEAAVESSSYSNVSQFLFNTSSITNLFDGSSNYFGIGEVGDTDPRYVVQINSKGTSLQGEVAECQSLPTISAVTTDLQYSHSESINLASTFYDPSARPNASSAIIEHGFFIGTDSGSATNNTKYISTGSNKIFSATVTANQDSGRPGIEYVEVNYYNATTLTKETSRTSQVSGGPFTSSICMVATDSSSLRDYVGTTGNAYPLGNQDFTVTIDTGSIACGDTPYTSSWETYSGLTPNTQYYAWAYVSSSLGMTTSSREDFKTVPNNLIVFRVNDNTSTVRWSNYSGSCVNCSNGEVTIGNPQTANHVMFVSASSPSQTFPYGMTDANVYGDANFGSIANPAISEFFSTGDNGIFYATGPYALEYAYYLSQSVSLQDNTIYQGVVQSFQGSLSTGRVQYLGEVWDCSGSCP